MLCAFGKPSSCRCIGWSSGLLALLCGLMGGDGVVISELDEVFAPFVCVRRCSV